MNSVPLFNNRAQETGLMEGYIRALASQDKLHILEAGCGRRWPLKLDGVKISITAVDTDAAALAIRRDVVRDIENSFVGDLREPKLVPNGAFDVVYSSFVLEHVDGAEQVLRNFLTWLKPRGMIILRIPDRNAVYGFITRNTPFRLHVLYKKYIEHMPNAGKPGFDPYPTFYDPIVSRPGIHEFCRKHNCSIREEYGRPYYLEKKSPTIRLVLRAVVRTVSALSLARLAWRHNDLVYIIQKNDGLEGAR